jgi:hypothetical protein
MRISWVSHMRWTSKYDSIFSRRTTDTTTYYDLTDGYMLGQLRVMLIPDLHWVKKN